MSKHNINTIKLTMSIFLWYSYYNFIKRAKIPRSGPCIAAGCSDNTNTGCSSA